MHNHFQIIRACAAVTLLLLMHPAPLRADPGFPVGEEAHYTIHWGLLNCGTTSFSCEEVEWNGKPMIRVRVRAKSNWLVSTIYPVDDIVDCYIDPESGQSVRIEKNTSEGDKICKDILLLDREKNMAHWTSESDNITTNYPIEAGVCDAVSFLYEFRQHGFDNTDTRNFKLVVDSALHGISINAGRRETKTAGRGGEVICRRYTVQPKRDDLFVRKIPKTIWLSEDDHKIMVRMDLKVPVGKVRVVLDKYVPPKQGYTPQRTASN